MGCLKQVYFIGVVAHIVFQNILTDFQTYEPSKYVRVVRGPPMSIIRHVLQYNVLTSKDDKQM